MDAPFFRALVASLCLRLVGGRLGKIFEPAPGCLVFAHKIGRESSFLLFRPAKSKNILCLSPAKPPMPHDPGPRAMWLRKRVGDARILGCVADWPTLRLGLVLDGRALILDLREGPRLVDALPDDFGREPPWPALRRVLDDPEVWREYPHLSPSLRRHLRTLPEQEALLLLERLAGGEPMDIWIPDGHGGVAEPTLWPLFTSEAFRLDDPIEAARRVYEPLFYGLLAGEAREAAEAAKAASKRKKRLDSLLDRDEERLRGLLAHAREAEALQANLHVFEDKELPEGLDLAHPDGSMVRVALDPRWTAAQNMQRLFAFAAKGRRGLAHVAARREAVAAEAAENLREPRSGPEGDSAQTTPDVSPGQPLPKRWTKLPVKVFRTSEGFWVARGKSAKGNHALLVEGSSPHDYWLHAQDAPGAHVILRRDHPGQEVPERSLSEAAVLAALSSPLKESAWADVLLAEVRQVRTIKGAAAGLVRLEKPLRVLRVRPDPDLESRLSMS